MTEKEFLQAVRDLARLRGFLEYHPFDSRRSTPGFPDLTMVRDGRLVFAELKVGKNKPTSAQAEWLEELGKVPGVEAVVWWPDDWPEIEEALRRSRRR